MTVSVDEVVVILRVTVCVIVLAADGVANVLACNHVWGYIRAYWGLWGVKATICRCRPRPKESRRLEYKDARMVPIMARPLFASQNQVATGVGLEHRLKYL